MRKNLIQSKTRKRSNLSVFNDFWSKNNYYLLFFGIFVLLIGYYFMSFEPWNNFISLNLSPIVLLFGYLIIIPLSIILRFNKKENASRKS